MSEAAAMVWVRCLVRSPHGEAGRVVQVEHTEQVDHYLEVGVLEEAEEPEQVGGDAPASEPDGGDGGEV